jgi:Carboxypeptidase regulatory-like domain
MLQPFDSELGNFVEEICADLSCFECAATAGCEPAQVSVEREVALGNDAFADIRVEAPKRPRPTRPQRTAVIQGVVRADNGALVPGAVIVIGGKQVATNSRGAFVVEDVPLGRQILVVSARSFAQSRLVLDLASGEVERVTLTLRRGAGLPMQAP